LLCNKVSRNSTGSLTMNLSGIGLLRRSPILIASTSSWYNRAPPGWKPLPTRRGRKRPLLAPVDPVPDSDIISWRPEVPQQHPPSPIGDVHWPAPHGRSAPPPCPGTRGADVHWSSQQSDDLISTVTGAAPPAPPRVPLPGRIVLLRHGEPLPNAAAASERIPEWKVQLSLRGVAQVAQHPSHGVPLRAPCRAFRCHTRSAGRARAGLVTQGV
jgi:hypothetical protein